jgi:ATP-binding cassette subfamily F protein 3
MSILTATNLSKAFGADEVFSGISVSVPPEAKIAIVGPNGAGKTTLVRILIGLDSPTDGDIHLAKNTRIGYLPQNPELMGEQTVYDEMLGAFQHLRAAEQELSKLEARLNAGDDELLERYGRLQEEFEAAGGYHYEIEIEQVLQGLGFPREQYDRRLNQLSGGQKTRALLARLLLEKPDLLALDEPTNHLDIDAIEWLENYLRNFQGAVLMISHDRYFMDNVVSVIWELDWGEVEIYRGTYSHYLQQREDRRERRLKEFEAQREFIEKEQDYIKRNIAGQNTLQAKGRLKRLERLIREGGLKKKPPRRRPIHINLQTDIRTGDQVLKTRGLQIGYDTPLLTVPDILLLRGEVAAVIGPNGVGKSTFLKTVLGRLNPLSGSAEWGAQVQVGYFAQAHEDLNPDYTLLDELLAVENLPVSRARNYLAAYLFTGDDVFRKVHTLSGGERGRLALAKLALSGANVLLLDEPTNHLDIPSQEVLQDVLADFRGTILLVSHDRYLIDALASQIWHITPGQMTIFKGSYAEYIAQRRQAAQGAALAKQTSASVTASSKVPGNGVGRKQGLTPYQAAKRVAELETLIHDLQEQIAQITTRLEVASAAGQVEQVAHLGEQYTQTESRLNDVLEEWATLAE